MSLAVTNIENLKTAKQKIVEAKSNYDEAIKNLKQINKNTEITWQGKNADDFRAEVGKLLYGDLESISKEFEIEIRYLEKITTVLENAEDQVKQRLNV